MKNNNEQHQPAQRSFSPRIAKGFTLVELSIVLLITGLIVGALAQLADAKYKLYLLNKQTQTLATIQTAIATYYTAHGHLPCPSAPALAQTDPNFGVGAACTGADVTPPLRTAGAAGRPGTVRIGGVPVRDLGLANSYAVNPWNYRLTYAVTEALAQSATYNIMNGAIDFVDGNNVTVMPGGVAGTALYALVDPGIDGAGAYSGYAGVLHAPCPAGGMETDNCNGGATFRTMPLSYVPGPGYFDDIAMYEVNIATNSLISSLVPGYVLFGGSTGSIAQDIPEFFYNVTSHDLGVGTTTPLSRLDVNGGLAVGSYAGTNAAPANGMIVSGNVGIGTTGPDRKLTTAATNTTTDDDLIKMYGLGLGNGYTNRFFQIGRNNNGTELISSGDSGYNYFGVYMRTSASGDSSNGLAASMGLTPALYINGSSNVGIGTTSPNTSLTIASGVASALSGNGNSSGLDLYMTAQGVAYIDSIPFPFNSSILTLRTYNNGTFNPGILIDQHGNVGIGIAPIVPNLSYMLQVNGTAYATGAAGALSDRRHKKDIQPYAPDALDIVSKLKPVTFLWKEPKDDGMKGRQIGFIAQDVQPVVPDAVLTEKNAEKTLGLKYDSFIPILTKAIQELAAKFTVLVSEVGSQKSEVQELKADNDNEAAQIKALTARLAALEAAHH